MFWLALLMAESIWYFAVGDEERGPVSEVQIRMLIGSGNLSRNDLVWKEGMEDWTPAGKVPGLFDKEPAGSVSAIRPAKKETPAPQPKPAEPEAKAAVMTAPLAAPRRETPAFDLAKSIERFRGDLLLWRAILVAGLMLVLLAQGCESLATRYVNRITAKSQIVEQQFQDDWDGDKAKLRQREQEIETRSNATTADRETLNEIRRQIRQLDDANQAEMERLRQGAWRELQNAARDATANQAIWSFWRHGLFLLGTFVLAAGLFALAFAGKDAERWMSLAMLAILVLSFFFKAGIWAAG